MATIRWSLSRRILPALHVQPGEGRCVAWMVLYSAAAAVVMALGYSAGGALFLAGLPPSATAFMFIASGASELLVFLLYAAAGSRLGQGSLVLLSDGLLLTAILVLRGLLGGPHGQSFAMLLAVYLAVDSAAMLSLAQFWARATRVFDARSARRLIGLAAAGGTLATMAAGLLLQTLTPLIGVANLLILVAAALAVCMLCSGALERLARARVSKRDERSAGTPHGGAHERTSLAKDVRAIVNTPLLLAIAGLTILISLIVNTGYYQFFMATQLSFAGNSQEMAEFMGAYVFWAALAALIVQLFLTVRILKRLGLFLALLVFPLAVALGSVLALVTGGALLAITLVKAADPALRQTLNQSALTVLYSPVPDGLRQRAKFFLDAIYALSFGLLGVGLVAAQHVPGWTYVTWCIPVLALIGVWLLLLRWSRANYLVALAANLRHGQPADGKVAAGASRVLERSQPPSEPAWSGTATRSRLMGEIRAFYESCLVQAGVGQEDCSAMLDSFCARREQALHRIFLLLGALYPNYPMASVRQAVTSEEDHLHATAVELLDCLLDRRLTAALVPILELSADEMLRVAREQGGRSRRRAGTTGRVGEKDQSMLEHSALDTFA